MVQTMRNSANTSEELSDKSSTTFVNPTLRPFSQAQASHTHRRDCNLGRFLNASWRETSNMQTQKDDRFHGRPSMSWARAGLDRKDSLGRGPLIVRAALLPGFVRERVRIFCCAWFKPCSKLVAKGYLFLIVARLYTL